jgi:hypothetical protein
VRITKTQLFVHGASGSGGRETDASTSTTASCAFSYPITGWRESCRRDTIEGVLMILTPPLREYRRPGPAVFRGGPPPRYEPPREPEPVRRRRRIQRYLPGQARFTRVAQRVRRPLRRRG